MYTDEEMKKIFQKIFGISSEKDEDNEVCQMYTNEEMEKIFGIPFKNDEEYNKKINKLKELKKKYKEKFGEEIEYHYLDCEGYDIEDELRIVEEALKDDKPFVSIDNGKHEITFNGQKLEWWY